MQYANIFEPKTINEIYTEIVNSPCGFIKWFRVRDIYKLKDYLVTGFIGDLSDTPFWADAIDYEENSPLTIDCNRVKYTLLSSQSEMIQFKRYKKEAIITEIYKAYTYNNYYKVFGQGV